MKDWLGFLFFLAVFVIHLLDLPSAWRGKGRFLPDRTSGDTTWAAFNRGVERLSVVGLLVSGPIAAYLGAIAITSRDEVEEAIQGWEPLFGIWAIVSFGLVFSVVVYNTPKLLIPPARRNERGLIDWLEGRKGTKSRESR